MRGEFQDFLKKVCCLTALKNSVGEPLSVTLLRVVNNFVLERENHDFLRKIRCLTVAKNFVGSALCAVSENYE